MCLYSKCSSFIRSHNVAKNIWVLNRTLNLRRVFCRNTYIFLFLFLLVFGPVYDSHHICFCFCVYLYLGYCFTQQKFFTCQYVIYSLSIVRENNLETEWMNDGDIVFYCTQFYGFLFVDSRAYIQTQNAKFVEQKILYGNEHKFYHLLSENRWILNFSIPFSFLYGKLFRFMIKLMAIRFEFAFID